MSNAGTLPTADDFFGSKTSADSALPTADEFFKPPEPSFMSKVGSSISSAVNANPIVAYNRAVLDFGVAAYHDATTAPVAGDHNSSPALDAFWAANPAARILHAFGQGAQQSWGSEPLGLGSETEATLRKAGVFNDYASGRTSILKSVNEAFMRPAAAAGNAIWRTLPALASGTESAIAQTGIEADQTPLGSAIGAKSLGEAGAGIIEYEMSRGDLALHPLSPESFAGARGPLVTDLTRARSLGVVGEGEAGYFGTAAPTLETLAERADASRQMVAEQPPQAEIEPVGAVPSAQPLGGPEAPEAAAAPDIHTVARQIAPDTFREYDALQTRVDTFRRWINELQDKRAQDAEASAPHTAEIDDLHARLDDPETTPRLRKKYEARLADLEPKNEDFIDQATHGDNADVARVRAELQAADYRLRDLAPDVAKAYRDAQERYPQQPEEPAVEPVQQPVAAPAAEAAAQPTAEQPSAADGAPAQPRAVEPPINNLSAEPAGKGAVPDIAGDVQQKLVAAGRPEDEAKAAGALLNAYYETRAARFGGKRGAAAEMYAREAPDIVRGRTRVKSMAQRRGGTYTFGAARARDTIRLFQSADASTFVHEVGHDWLEQLTRDAADPTAPADLVRDNATVRDWLGVKEGETIPTKAHEKFARGFERYMMEGVAPSKALATVFAKFRDWLTKIYQTVNKLRSPINEDIRAVFDRMLAQNPERTVIAPDRESLATLADHHEKLADETPPEKSAETAETIRSEIDAKARTIDPKVADELTTAGPSREPVAIAGENEGATSGGNAPEPEAGPAGEPDRTGAVAEGGNTAAEESPIGRDADANAANAGAARKPEPKPTPAPTDANARFSEPESDLVDKAGNIVLKNLNTPEDVNQVLRDTAAQNDNFMHARRGVLSIGEQLDLAEAAGLDPTLLDGKELGHAYNAEQIIALRKLLVKSSTELKDFMRTAATGSDEDVLAYAEAKTRHQMFQRIVQERVSAAAAEAGRALAAFRNLKGMGVTAEGAAEATITAEDIAKDTTGRTLNQLRQEARLGATLQTPAQVSRWVASTSKYQKFRSALIEYYVNCLISGPITHFRYSVGNALNAVFSAGIETPIAAAIGSIREGLGFVKEGDRVYAREVPAELFAITKGSREGWRAGYEAFKTGVSPALPGEKLHDNFGGRAIPGKIGEVINLPSKSVSAIHSFFKSIRYEQAMSRMAVRSAIREGLTGTGFDNRVADLTMTPSSEMMASWEDRESYDELEGALAARDIARGEGLTGAELDGRIKELVSNPVPEMKAALDSGRYTQTARIIAENAVSATKESLRELYMAPTEYGSAMGWLNRAVNGNLLFKIMAPFMKIGLQITRNAFLERTPLGFVDKDIRADLLGDNGGAAQDMQWAKMTAGTALMGITYGLAAEGLATGDGPEDPQKRQVWLLSHKPNTLQIGDLSIPYQGLGSIGMLMRFAANTHQVAASIGDETADKVAIAALEGISKSVLDENFMRGVKDALDAVYHPEEYGSSYIKQFATNWLPFSVGMSQVARQIDSNMRETKTGDFWSELWNTVKQKTPFVSEGLPPRRDMFGNPIPSSGIIQSYADDPAVKAMDALQIGVGRLEPKIRGVQLTPEQFDDYGRIAGGMTKMQLDAIVALPGFDTLPSGVRIEMLHKAISGSRETARSLIMMRSMNSTDPANPDIVRAAMNAKLSIVTEP